MSRDIIRADCPEPGCLATELTMLTEYHSLGWADVVCSECGGNFCIDIVEPDPIPAVGYGIVGRNKLDGHQFVVSWFIDSLDEACELCPPDNFNTYQVVEFRRPAALVASLAGLRPIPEETNQ